MHRDTKERNRAIKITDGQANENTEAPGPGCVEKIQRSTVSVAVREGEERC